MSWWVDATTNASGSSWSKVWVSPTETSNTIAGPYATEAAAKQGAQETLGVQPLTGWRGTLAVLGGALGGAVSPNDVGTGINAGEALGGVNLGNWFLRIGEILLGIVLVGVGVAKISGAENVVSSAIKVAPK